MNHGPHAGRRLIFGLLLTPVAVALAVQLLPQLQVSDGVANFVAFVGATTLAIAALAICTTVAAPTRAVLGVVAAAAFVLGTVAYGAPFTRMSLVSVDAALVALAWGLGGSLGGRVQHASHLFPACIVAASADVVSLLSPEGPSHAIARDERALSVLAMGFPVPGTESVSPVLGVGDLLFIAFVLGCARVHGLGYGRAIVCVCLGVAAAGFAAARWGTAVPALVTIAAAIVIGFPATRRLRPADRTAARASMVIALSLVVATLARHALSN